MKTLFLRPETWDLALDISGNIAFATSTYQQAQDIASACRLFTKDQYFSQKEGIPYLSEILGSSVYPLALYRRYLIDAALTVAGVTGASVDLVLSGDRIISGELRFTNEDGKEGLINL